MRDHFAELKMQLVLPLALTQHQYPQGTSPLTGVSCMLFKREPILNRELDLPCGMSTCQLSVKPFSRIRENLACGFELQPEVRSMPVRAARSEKAAVCDHSTEENALKRSPKVIVCVGGPPLSAKVIPHAHAIASTLGAELVLTHVIESDKSQYSPFDPVDWDMRRREAQDHLSSLARQFESRKGDFSTNLLEGRPAEQICSCTHVGPRDIIALCRSSGEIHHQFGETARRVMEMSSGSILLVPATVIDVKKAAYSRILVPLDGSSQAESAIPFAVKIAASQKAELLLVHATATPELVQSGPLEIEDIELQKQLAQRNELAGRTYLDQVRGRLSDCSVVVRTLILKGHDVPRSLTAAISDQSVSIVVLSAYGHSGFADVPSGHVSSFIASRSEVPVLMVRRPQETEAEHIFSDIQSKGVRLPSARTG
jgi:nucleotide-binding universal stress UspA family protein